MFEVKPLPFSPDSLEGISEQQIKFHHDVHYAAYVNNRNKIEAQLEEMRKKGEFGDLRGLKLSESHNASGMMLHEAYFDCMGGKGGEAIGELAEKIKQDFGSFENWKKEVLSIAVSARGWVLLCFDPSDGNLHNYSVDYHDIGAVWGSTPVLALDLWEHAYYLDQGPNKAKYIEAFFRNLNWERINQKFKEVSSKF
ncbi:MAG TPA: superoxide dismutase [archaeon]|nr:superoxide dismutase [archaeon]